MDYNYMSAAQINSLDYWSLANMLIYQITPEIRKQVLRRLTEMNDRLLMNGNSLTNSLTNLPINIPESQITHQDPSRMTNFSSKKKDLPENKYPYMDTGYNNPIPLSLPNNKYHNISQQMPMKKTLDISVDDIIDDIIEDSPQSDDLDTKLAKIKRLYDKVKANKRKNYKH